MRHATMLLTAIILAAAAIHGRSDDSTPETAAAALGSGGYIYDPSCFNVMMMRGEYQSDGPCVIKLGIYVHGRLGPKIRLSCGNFELDTCYWVVMPPENNHDVIWVGFPLTAESVRLLGIGGRPNITVLGTLNGIGFISWIALSDDQASWTGSGCSPGFELRSIKGTYQSKDQGFRRYSFEIRYAGARAPEPSAELRIGGAAWRLNGFAAWRKVGDTWVLTVSGSDEKLTGLLNQADLNLSIPVSLVFPNQTFTVTAKCRMKRKFQ